MQKWVNQYTAFYTAPNLRARRYRYLVEGTVVTSLDEIITDTALNVFERVEVAGVTGWVDAARIEPYIESLPKDCVYIADIQTPENDAPQYVNWGGRKQVNMCGELALCYIMGISLSEMLTRWQQKTPPLYKRIFGAGVARGTGAAELVEIAAVFGRRAAPLNMKRYTPHALQRMVDTSAGVIVSCHIDGYTGRLRGKGVLHWVTVTRVIPERTGYGGVELYNPFVNRVELYSWGEFVASCGAPYGAQVLE